MGKKKLEILVVGTGAVGGFYAGKLAAAGEAQVSVVCRSDFDAVKAHGITVESPWGNFAFHPKKVLLSAGECDGFPDYLFVAHKVLPEIDTAALVRDAVGPKTTLVLIQNGIAIEEPVARAFPESQILSALAFICVSRTGPGRILHQDYGRLVQGRYPAGPSEAATTLGALFERSGVPCQVTEDVITARWRKLVWNAPFNPISVLAGGADTRGMLGAEDGMALVRRVMEEVSRLAAATGHRLPADTVDRMIEDTRRMEPYKTSMLLDFESRRPMEVEAILGNAVRIARREDVPVPHLETLYALLKMLDEANRAARGTAAGGCGEAEPYSHRRHREA